MQYKVVFIDWDGTLSKSRFWGRWKDDPRSRSKYDLLQDILFTSEEGKVLLADWMIGAKSYSDIVDYTSGVTGIPYGDLEQELQYSAKNMQFIDKDVLRLIQQLRAGGVKVVIATDNMDTFSKWTVPAMELTSLFDDILTSNAIGAIKTHRSPENTSLFFSDYLSRHGIERHQSVLIDDNVSTKVVEQWGIDFLHVSETMPLTAHLQHILEGVDRGF